MSARAATPGGSTVVIPAGADTSGRQTASSGLRAVAITSFAILVASAGLLAMHAVNPRLLPSWHGFLHGAVAIRFPVSGVPPENPFFAGELLPYYWFYHFIGFMVQRLLGTDPVHAFQAIAFASLALLIAAGAAIGLRRFGSLPAGFAVGLLAIMGGNPLGFVTAAAKRLAGQPLIDADPPILQHVFVDNVLADRLMTHPLLAALHFGSDWRYGQNLPWFFDISSRTPVLALTVLLLFLWLGRTRVPNLAAIAAVGALTVALNPLIGLGLVGALVLAELPFAVGNLRREGRSVGARALAKPAAALAGVLLALPAFYHMLLLDGVAELSSLRSMTGKSVIAASVFVLLAPAAIAGVRRAPVQLRDRLRAIALAGALLVLGTIAIRLEEGNEHNISNLAQCVLAVPAAASLAWGFRWKVRGQWLGLAAVAVLCAPTAAATVVAFSGRPAAPLAFDDGWLQRVPADGPLQRAYEWIRASTPADAILVADPRRPIKMASNVSELPVFTARALFVDQPSYLVSPHHDAGHRAALAAAISDGNAPSRGDAAYLAALGRPLFLVSYDVEPGIERRLARQWGPPRFSAPPLAIYSVDPLPKIARHGHRDR